MKEIFLCKYGEIVLKGANQSYFEQTLVKELKFRLRFFGRYTISHAQSTIYIEPLENPNGENDIDGAFSMLTRVFGIVAIERAACAEKNMEDISRVVREYIPQFLEEKKTFKVESKRADKRFPLKSPEISAQVGGLVLSLCHSVKVDVHNPDVTVKVEVREKYAYVSAGTVKGAGGLPISTNGNGLLLLSGGIDSPVAGYMMAKRGVKIQALHFESFPYTSERAKQKVMELASLVSRYSGNMKVHVVSLTHIQEELVKNCDEEYFTLLLRRFMMTIAQKVAEKFDCLALITGESLGQVASQTLPAIAATDEVTSIPVLRPLIGMDKEEIITISKKIDAFETSILPYEDCCTVFTPKHPHTRPKKGQCAEAESGLDIEPLIERAIAGIEYSFIE